MDFYDVRLHGARAASEHLESTTRANDRRSDPVGCATSPSLYFHMPRPPTRSIRSPFICRPTVPRRIRRVAGSGHQILARTRAGRHGATIATGSGRALDLEVSHCDYGHHRRYERVRPGLPRGAIVSKIDATGLVTLSEERRPRIPGGLNLTFAPNLGALTVDQCRNIADEIVWSQQPPPPTPPNPSRTLHRSPEHRTDAVRHDAEPVRSRSTSVRGELTSYYALGDASADRLTTFVFALSAAVTCEQLSCRNRSRARLPSNPSGPASARWRTKSLVDRHRRCRSADELRCAGSVLLRTGGAPAGADWPRATPPARHRRSLARLLADLTAAITPARCGCRDVSRRPAATVNAAQAARRLATLGVSAGETLPARRSARERCRPRRRPPVREEPHLRVYGGLKVSMLVSGGDIEIGTVISALSATTSL